MTRFKPNPIATTFVAACALVASVIGLFSLESRAADDKAGAAAPKPAMTVTTAQPQRSSLPQRLSANGNIAAWQEAIIGSESNGLRLADVKAQVGDTVRKGQVLATFAADTIQADVAQARAALLEAEANAAEAQANAERARTLQSSGAMSASQINQYLTAAQTAQARVASAKAALQAQQLRLQFTEVRAPDAGVISSRTATVGAVVPAGTELFRMVRQGRLEWRAEVTAAELPRIQVGTPATVTAASGVQLNGRTRMVAPTVDPQTRNAIVFVDLPQHPQVRAGMFGQGEFTLGNTDALTVPQQALVVRDGFHYVFVVGPDQRVAQRKVETGRRVGTQVEILKGVDSSSTIAVQGAGFLNDGDVVRVSNPAPNQAPAQKTPAQAATK